MHTNIIPKYSKTGFLPLVESADDAYTFHEFNSIFSDIKDKFPELAEYLEDSNFRKWATCFVPSNRYNIMTTNIAVPNSVFKLPCEFPLIYLLETIRLTLTTWFFSDVKTAAKKQASSYPKVVKKLVSRSDDAMTLNVTKLIDVSLR